MSEAMKLTIDGGKCNACGLCVGNKYIEELSDGKVRAAGAAIVNESDLPEVKTLVEQCPEKAMSLSEVVSLSKNDVKKNADKYLSKFKLTIPNRSNFKYDKAYDRIIEIGYTCCFVPEEGRYEYRSERQAENAAYNAVEKYLYSKREQMVKDVLHAYKRDKALPYLSYEEVESNFFFNANNKAKSVLEKVAADVCASNPSLKIDAKYTSLNTRPDFRHNKMEYVKLQMDLFEQMTDTIIHRADEMGSLSSYAEYCDTDYTEMYVGTSRFGRDKYEDKYKFYNCSDAGKEIAKDLVWAINFDFEDSYADLVYRCIEDVRTEYETQLKGDMQKKIDAMLALL